jgi:carbonic anhydrase
MNTDTEWGYVGDVGPEHWASLSNEFCACDGSNQSPINLPAGAEPEGELQVSIHYAPATGRLDYTSYGVQMRLRGGSIQVDGSRHTLVQFHFHTPSEHRVDGRPFPGELHLVHLDENDHFTVIALLMKIGAHNPAVDAIWETFPKVENAAPMTFDASVLLPDKRTAYVYDGSLTTPPCSENVRWLVMQEPVEFSDVQIEQLTAVHASENIHNNRPVQALNGRSIGVLRLT